MFAPDSIDVEVYMEEIERVLKELSKYNRGIWKTKLTETFVQLIELVAKIEQKLNNELPSMDWFVPDPLDYYLHRGSVEKGTELTCSNCGMLYCPTPWKYAHQVVQYFGMDYVERHPEQGMNYVWPVCSEGCKEVLKRKLTYRRQERETQWEALQLAKQKLKEARAWLRERENGKHLEALPSQTKE